ncbi:PREDICTED: protein glass-like, partial [Priapulus caudatus]|uniref:Protein glass-like n=1 Tax=Priapulus caudatus TaxID=37621 RepID=A0ABM1F729_PRICU
RTHTGEKPYSCDSCEYKTANAGNLKKHKRTHTGDKPYSCKTCDYRCTTAGSLKAAPTDGSSVAATPALGDKVTGESSEDFAKAKDRINEALAYLREELRTHTGEKPYSCESCNYKTANAGNLKKHKRTHTGDKPYSCETCTYRCTTAGSLKVH